jgi:putative flippase GtrA
MLSHIPLPLRQFLKFGIVGGIGFVVDAGVLYACMKGLDMGPYTGRIVSFIAAASSTWFCNRHFTFKDSKGDDKLHVQWLKFLVVSMGGFVFNYGAYAALIWGSPLVAAYPVLGVAAGSIAGMFFNFFVSRKLVFR